jgi:hypothetical protein
MNKQKFKDGDSLMNKHKFKDEEEWLGINICLKWIGKKHIKGIIKRKMVKE